MVVTDMTLHHWHISTHCQQVLLWWESTHMPCAVLHAVTTMRHLMRQISTRFHCSGERHVKMTFYNRMSQQEVNTRNSSGDEIPERELALFCYPSCV